MSSVERATIELVAIRDFCRDEAAAEYNADDARTAFAIVRDRCDERIEELKQATRDDVYDELEGEGD